jgi:5'-nucleotidase
VAKRAAIVTAFADDGPGRHPESDVAALVAQAEAAVGTRVERTIIVSAQSILRQENEAGESALGNLIADAQRAALGTDFAFMNPGGIRTDIPSGPVRYRDLFALHPFGNVLVRLSLTGEEIYEVLNQQWAGQTRPRMLKVSGLSYRWDSRRPVGDRVIEVRRGNAPIDRQARYSVTVNDFLAAGGDNFTVLTRGRRGIGGVLDLDALITYLESQVQPVTAAIDGRIERVDEAAR